MGLSMTAPEREFQRGTEKSRKTSTVKNSAGKTFASGALNSEIKQLIAIRNLENQKNFPMREENENWKYNRNIEMKENIQIIVQHVGEMDRKRIKIKTEGSVRERQSFLKRQMDSIKEEDEKEENRTQKRLGVKEIREKKERIRNTIEKRRKQKSTLVKQEFTSKKQTNVKTSYEEKKVDCLEIESFLPISTFGSGFQKRKYSHNMEKRPKNLIPF